MSDNKLILHPVNPWAILHDPPQLIEALRSLGFAGAGFNYYGDLHHKPGPRFRELVVFKDAAAAAQAPPDTYHVGVVETTPRPTFLGAANAQGPVCGACQARMVDWKQQLLLWQTEKKPYTWHCPKCGQALAIEKLEWGKTGGFARYSIEVCGISEGAAEPTPELLSFLQAETLEHWRYFYYRL